MLKYVVFRIDLVPLHLRNLEDKVFEVKYAIYRLFSTKSYIIIAH